MADLKQQILKYQPVNEQEAVDREEILMWLETGLDLSRRECLTAHLTASSWVVSPDRKQVLMVHHNLYRSWSWLGGHADGEWDLSAVALREVREESGLEHIRLVTPEIFSLEILAVSGHFKHGSYVPSHLHLNATYLIEGDPAESLRVKPDENSAVMWFAPEDALRMSREPWFREFIYPKLIRKADKRTFPLSHLSTCQLSQ
ncbi:MAG: NUDIX hydrolase [Mogibacterium sp.]|nr:NUDIX hydrolase [Mogibacterium sp.]